MSVCVCVCVLMCVCVCPCPPQTTVYTVDTYYTFGQPRVGNVAYADYFKSILPEYRVVHYADIVPHLPLEAMGFHHVPTEVRVCVLPCGFLLL